MANDAKINQRIEAEATQAFIDKDKLEQVAAVGISGPPKLRRWERSQFLGQFPEQVLWAITSEVLCMHPASKELVGALADPRCCHIFVKATEVQHARVVLQVAKQRQLPITVVHSPEFRNDVAVVITTTEEHNQEEIFVEPRR